MKRFAKGLVPCMVMMAILIAALPNQIQALTMQEAYEAATKGILNSDVRRGLQGLYKVYLERLASKMESLSLQFGIGTTGFGYPAAVRQHNDLGMIPLYDGNVICNYTAAAMHVFQWLDVMKSTLEKMYGTATAKACYDYLKQQISKYLDSCRDTANFYYSCPHPPHGQVPTHLPPPPPVGPQGMMSKPGLDKLRDKISDKLMKEKRQRAKAPMLDSLKNAKKEKLDLARLIGPLSDERKLAVDRKLTSTPVIKMTAEGKVARDSISMPKPAGPQLTMQRSERGGKIAANPQLLRVAQPAVIHAKVEKAAHTVASLHQPMPRPVPRAALGRR